jgi:hypothetical protein
MTIQKWQELLSQINLIEPKNPEYPEVDWEYDLLSFEIHTGIILPTEYKEFLQVFGAGEFGGGIFYVYPPNIEFSQEDLKCHLINVDKKGFLKNDLILRMGYDYVPREESEKAIELLKSSYFFGGSTRQESLFWDFRTYSQQDESYDIYLARISRIPVKIGRSFFEFVHDICFGLNTQTVFPIQLQPYLNEISLVFHKY